MDEPSYIDIDSQNVHTEHLCCALGDKKHEAGVEAKRRWLAARFEEGLVFRKLDVRGKVFIEYMPSEHAWRPIEAPGWMTIHCLWVSGRFAGHGHARALLESCIEDTRQRGRAGVVVATARRKRPFLGDPKFFRAFGFARVDEAGEFELLARRLDADAPTPRFTDAVRRPDPGGEGPFVARYTDQCPLNAHWASEMVGSLTARGCPAEDEHIVDAEAARSVASPLGTFGLESDGGLVTHHLNTDAAVGRLLEKRRRDR